MFPTRRFYVMALVVSLLSGCGYWFAPLFGVGQMMLCCWLLATLTDVLLLYAGRRTVEAERVCAGRFSNGDDNLVRLKISGTYPWAVKLVVIDEAPFVFQRRDLLFYCTLFSDSVCEVSYTLHPVQRGEFGFGHIRLFVSTRLGLVQRRFTSGKPFNIKVYPSYLMLRNYELEAIGHNLTDVGTKRIRRVGHQAEFEHIREYVLGNDFRTINWKATARRHQLMVNVYREEGSQEVYSVIDKGRVMQQAFGGMTLLDYAVNASLVFSYVAVHREDKAGLVTFSDSFGTFVPASRREGQMKLLSESLYKERTGFGETDFSTLCVYLSKNVLKRSLLVLYTNFTSLVEVRRQLSFLQNLSARHCVLVVFFEDDDVRNYALGMASDAEECYSRVMAGKYVCEKKQIVTLLKQYGVMSLLTSPSALTVDVINKYIEIKTKHLI